MLEKIIKKDRNEELEKILEKKNVDEQSKNLLQGILYKIEISYKDYKKAKAIETSEKQYVDEILKNIKNRCSKISTIRLSEKLENSEIQEQLEKNKFYINEQEIIVYPIEEKILYAIQKKSNNKRIVSNKYGISTIPVSNLINTGKDIDKVEVLRDFNGYSWTTIKKEIENIKVNLIYQTLQILMGEEFLNSWIQDTDGIIDYIEMMQEILIPKYGEEIFQNLKKVLFKVAIINEIENNQEFRENIEKEFQKIKSQLQEYEDTQKYVQKITDNKKIATQKIKQIEKILSQETALKAEYERRNEGVELHQKIFSIRVLKQQLQKEKQKLLNEIEEGNYYLNPINYITEKNEIIKQYKLLEVVEYDEEQKEETFLEFEKIFLDCFEKNIEKLQEQQEVLGLIYKFRYFMLLPFNEKKSIKNIKELQEKILKIEEKLLNIAIQKKVVSNISLQIFSHVLETRIIILEELYYKISNDNEKYYVQIFDENITEERFEIQKIENMKIDKKTKIFL